MLQLLVASDLLTLKAWGSSSGGSTTCASSALASSRPLLARATLCCCTAVTAVPALPVQVDFIFCTTGCHLSCHRVTGWGCSGLFTQVESEASDLTAGEDGLALAGLGAQHVQSFPSWASSAAVLLHEDSLGCHPSATQRRPRARRGHRAVADACGFIFRESGVRRLTSATCCVASKLVSDRRLDHTLLGQRNTAAG